MIDNLLKRTSVRFYSNKKVEDQKINILKDVINSSPTSTNSQAFSAIFVTNKELIEKLAKANWNQKHIYDAPLLIIFVADLNRIIVSLKSKNKDIDHLKCMEHFVVAAVDCGIASTICQAALSNLGLGSCYLGGFRNSPKLVKELLNLPSNSYPILGLSIGYESKNTIIKPKVNKCYHNFYNFDLMNKELEDYNKIMQSYHESNFNLEKDYFDVISSASQKVLDDKFIDNIKEYFFK